ncbi:MAG: heparin lyase I family protein [Hyphomicrobiales bacterium]
MNPFHLVVVFLLASAFAATAQPVRDPPKGYPRCMDIRKDFDISNGFTKSSYDMSRFVSKDLVAALLDPGIDHHAVRITWAVGDFIAHGYRAEVADLCLPDEGEQIYYSLAFLIPTNILLDHDKSVLIGQFHTPDAGHKPQIALRYRGWRHFDITLNFDVPEKDDLSAYALQRKPLRIKNLRRNRWHHLELLVRWSAKENGSIDLVFNGDHVLHCEGRNNYITQNGFAPHFKYGLYPSDSNSWPLTIHHAFYDRMHAPDEAFLRKRGFRFSAGALKPITFNDGDDRMVINDR